MASTRQPYREFGHSRQLIATGGGQGIGLLFSHAGTQVVRSGDCFATIAGMIQSMARRYHHHVYVVELSRDVLYEARFMKANPDYVQGQPCVYVGMTGLDPDRRFDKHKAGIQANRYVQRFGLHLLPALYAPFNPMPYDGARDMEVELAISLREAGYGVWQA